MFIFFVSYMSPRGLGAADAYHLYSTPIPEVIVVAVPPPKKDWFSAIPKGRQANAPFGQTLSALAIRLSNSTYLLYKQPFNNNQLY